MPQLQNDSDADFKLSDNFIRRNRWSDSTANATQKRTKRRKKKEEKNNRIACKLHAACKCVLSIEFMKRVANALHAFNAFRISSSAKRYHSHFISLLSSSFFRVLFFSFFLSFNSKIILRLRSQEKAKRI